MTFTPLDMTIHHKIVRQFIDAGRPPSSAELGIAVGVDVGKVELSLLRLASQHALVLHPHVCEVWVAHPFSASPTHTWVGKGDRGWWAPCMWCGLGVAALVGGDTLIQTRIGGESQPIDIRVHDGYVTEENLWVHFPEPPRLAWNNVLHFCARLLPFRSPADIAPWSKRHGFGVGEAVPLGQLAELARYWYNSHAKVDWQKWTVAEAAEIFHRVGLKGNFWELEAREGNF